MSRSMTKSGEKVLLNEFREVTGASTTDASKWLKKYKYNFQLAIEGYFNEGADMVARPSGRDNEKKIAAIWERFKDPASPKLITIEGTMELCQELDVDPESDTVLFCLAHDLGSKETGSWEKEPFVAGWLAIDPKINSLESMKAALPALRKKLNEDPVYFKKVYMHAFELSKAPGARVLALDAALGLWTVFITPALHSRPSALSRLPPGAADSTASGGPPAFGDADLELWLDFQRAKNKAVSKDTWSLFIDFIRTIDSAYKEYDEEAAWPSTIDDFVEYARARK